LFVVKRNWKLLKEMLEVTIEAFVQPLADGISILAQEKAREA